MKTKLFRMKRAFIIVTLLTVVFTTTVYGQEEEKGFKKENLFTGGSVTISFFNKQTLLGANPIFGYKLTDWADAGLAFNFVYNSSRDYQAFNDKIRQTVYGPGVFARLYPIRFLFVQGQLEHNFSTVKYIPPTTSGIGNSKWTNGANSLLLGAGLAQGRAPGSTSFFYISLLFDVLKNENSPYVNVSVNPNNPSQRRVDMVPIIRAGVNVGLFQGKYR